MNPENILDNFRQEWHNEIQSVSRRETSAPNGLLMTTSHSGNKSNETQDELKAAELFNHGVWLEKRGEHYEAIKFYSKAISIDPDVELKVYRQNYLEKTNVSQDHEGNIDKQDRKFHEDDLMSRFESLLITKSICAPMFKQSSTHISELPNEMFHKILLWVVSDELDLQSLDMLSGVCRGFYLLCRNSDIWKKACIRVWGQKGYISGNSEGYLSAGYTSWREMFLLRPRLRLNGCYISRTSYFRKSESSFQDESYEPYQSVTYYRYLRCFADGMILMLTSAEPPQGMVAHLKKKDCANSQIIVGRYKINANVVSMTFRMPSKKKLTKTRNRIIAYSTTDVAETFLNIDMKIHSVDKRQNWQLTWHSYVITSYLCTGKSNTSIIDTKDSTKFPSLLFSRVKSYCLESEAPLV